MKSSRAASVSSSVDLYSSVRLDALRVPLEGALGRMVLLAAGHGRAREVATHHASEVTSEVLHRVIPLFRDHAPDGVARALSLLRCALGGFFVVVGTSAHTAASCNLEGGCIAIANVIDCAAPVGNGGHPGVERPCSSGGCSKMQALGTLWAASRTSAGCRTRGEDSMADAAGARDG